MTKLLNLLGPPGSGKTSTIQRLVLGALGSLRPDQIGVVTYTRAGGDELKERFARALGLDPDPRTMSDLFPFVGTIHSICFRLMRMSSSRVVDQGKMAEFCREIGVKRTDYRAVLHADDDDDASLSKDTVHLMLTARSLALHCGIPMKAAVARLPVESFWKAGGDWEHLDYLSRQYQSWKLDKGYYDYDDMLLQAQGSPKPLPVRLLVVDEAQDNTRLMWNVIDSWIAKSSFHSVITAGDPWQAIYEFSGAAPDLFQERPGEWRKIDDSHRFGPEGATFAREILRPLKLEENLSADQRQVFDWTGVGGTPRDGTTFFLGRTGALLWPLRKKLQDAGLPYGELRGGGPLTGKMAAAWKTSFKLLEEQTVALGDVIDMVAALPQFREKTKLMRRFKNYDDERSQPVTIRDLPQVFGTMPAEKAEDVVEWCQSKMWNNDYMSRLVAKYGVPALYAAPRITVGTIHAAKGKEADSVFLCRSWGARPGRSLIEGERSARVAEACVAYVGATRHRSRLGFWDGDYGVDYPFPALPEDKETPAVGAGSAAVARGEPSEV